VVLVQVAIDAVVDGSWSERRLELGERAVPELCRDRSGLVGDQIFWNAGAFQEMQGRVDALRVEQHEKQALDAGSGRPLPRPTFHWARVRRFRGDVNAVIVSATSQPRVACAGRRAFRRPACDGRACGSWSIGAPVRGPPRAAPVRGPLGVAPLYVEGVL